MLKYVNTDFQISVLKQVIWLSLYQRGKIEAIFKRLNIEITVCI